MQVAQRQPGVDAQLVAERAVQLAVHGEGICLPAAAVEREHQLRVQLLVVRVVLDQPVQFRYEPSVLAEGQPGLDQRPGGLQPEPAQPLGVLVQPGAPGEVGEVRQRLAPPEPERCAQVALTVDWVRRHGGVADQAFGGLHVGDLGADIEHVARRPVADRGPAARTCRRWDTWLCTVFSAVGGAASPQTASTSRWVLTISPGCRASIASTAMRRSPRTGRAVPSTSTSTGPSSRTCMATVNSAPPKPDTAPAPRVRDRAVCVDRAKGAREAPPRPAASALGCGP